MLQKIIGIIGILAVAGAITMVALSPRAEGFSPGMFDFLKRAPKTETLEAGTIYVPETSVSASGNTISQVGAAVVPNSQADTLCIEQQRDTISIE
jgi:hypothetical protein